MNEMGKEIRQCRTCKEEVLNYPQPGYFSGKILFVFQNPARPRSSKWQDDVIKNKDATIEELNDAYKSTLQNDYIGKFIDDLGLKWNNISITNLVKCPTYNNTPPSELVVNSCKQYILKQIDIFKPKLIILNGAMPKKFLYPLLKDKYTVLCFYHYAYIARIGKMEEYVEGYKCEIEEALKNVVVQQRLL